MIDYQKIEQKCNSQSELFKNLVDEFLIYYCAEQEGLVRIFASKLSRFKHVVEQLPETWPSHLMAQYVSFLLFRNNGFAQKYVNRPEIVCRTQNERVTLAVQIANPWRYAFCSVVGNPALHFYDMTDKLTGETFLLYSPGLTGLLQSHGPMQMFFLLIGFNGQCWQTYGPLYYFKGIITTDLLFFAQQLDPKVVSLNQIPELIDRDPIPWTMLYRSGEIPLTFHRNEMILIICSKYTVKNFEPDKYSDAFKIETKYPLYKMYLKRWGRFPHFAVCYYHKKKQRLIVSCNTDRGYEKLIETFRKIAHDLPENPQQRLTVNMLCTAQEILKKHIQLNPYEKAFSKTISVESSDQINKVNKFLHLLTNDYNPNKKIDIDRLASLAEIDKETATYLAEHAMKTFEKSFGRKRR